MGKTRSRRKNNGRQNCQPTGMPSLKESEESELNTNNDETAIQTIIEEIQSTNIEERLCGLQSLVTLSEKPENVEFIIKYNIIKIVAPLLVEKNSEVRNFTAGILRNMSASNSVEICERLVKDDLMTPLIALLHQYSDWKPETSNPDDRDTLLQLINILWNLCETDETALKYFNSSNLMNLLLQCLNYEAVGLDLTIAVCQCLNCISEENSTVISTLRIHESDLLNLLSIKSSGNKFLLLKTLITGIILVLRPSPPWLSTVLTVIHEALKDDIRIIVNQLSSHLPLDTTSPLSAELQAKLDDTQTLVEAQVMALEILANLTCSQDDEMEMESEVSDDEDGINGWNEANETQPLAVSTEVQEGLEKYKLVLTVLSKIEKLPENVTNIINHFPSSRTLAKKLVRLQCRAFLCFNNLVSVVDIEQLGGPQHLYSLVKHISNQWLTLELQYENGPTSEILEASTAGIRAILLRLASNKFTDVEGIKPADLEVIFKIGLSPEPRIQANVIRIVGTLGVLLVNKDAVIVKVLGQYLLELAEKPLALWLIAEALDAVLDLFSEDCTDQVAVEINLVPRLQAITPRLKAKMRQERKTLGEHYAVVSTVIANLTPFIKYKDARVSALSNL